MAEPSESAETHDAAEPAKQLPDFGFEIVLARRNSSVVVGDVHMGQDFDLRASVRSAREELVGLFGEDSLDVTLIDQFSSIIGPLGLHGGLDALDHQQVAERLVDLLAAIVPHVHRAIVASDDNTSRQLSDLAERVGHSQKGAERTMLIMHRS